MSKPLIPFGVMPGHWGLKGKTREIARAEYELEGYDLELRICEITSTSEDDFKINKLKLDVKAGKITPYDYDLGMAIISTDVQKDREYAILNVDFKYGKVSQKQFDYGSLDYNVLSIYDRKIAKLKLDYKYEIKSEKEYDFELLEYQGLSELDKNIESLKLEFKHGMITETSMNQSIATLKGEAWSDIRVIPDKDDPRYGTFKIDCNQLFLDKLHDVGVLAPDKDSLLDLYITDFCKSVAMPSVKDTVSILEEIRRQSATVVADSLDDFDE